jgi:hypothetical protein
MSGFGKRERTAITAILTSSTQSYKCTMETTSPTADDGQYNQPGLDPVEMRLLNLPLKSFHSESQEIPSPSTESFNTPRTGASHTGTPTLPKYRQYATMVGHVVFATILSVLLSFYTYETLVNPNPKLGRLLFSPPTTFLVITIISHVIPILLRQSFVNVFDALRWSFASRSKGVPLTTFLGLSSVASLASVFRLFCEQGEHRFWCLQRY